MPDGTHFLLGNEFKDILDANREYLTVTVKKSDGEDRYFKMYSDDFSIKMPWASSGTNTTLAKELFAVLESVVSPFRPAAKDASRRSARKQRKSRRTNRRKGTRQRSSKK